VAVPLTNWNRFFDVITGILQPGGWKGEGIRQAWTGGGGGVMTQHAVCRLRQGILLDQLKIVANTSQSAVSEWLIPFVKQFV